MGFFRKGEGKNLKFYRCKLKSGNKVGSDTCVGTYFLYTFGGGGGTRGVGWRRERGRKVKRGGFKEVVREKQESILANWG